MSDPSAHRIRTVSAAVLVDAIRSFGTAKEIARACDCSIPTAKRYRRGETMPDPLRLARLMGRSRAVAHAMLRLAGLDDLSMDLEEARLRGELRVIEERKAANAANNAEVRAMADRVLGAKGAQK